MSVVIDGTNGVSKIQDGVIETADLSDGIVTPSKLSQPFTSGTAVTASGTSVDFTGIPAWVKRITVMFSGVSTNGTSPVQVQLGDSGGVETSGYLGAASLLGASSIFTELVSTGFREYISYNAAALRHGKCEISFIGSNNTWIANMQLHRSDNAQGSVSSGSKALSDTLDRIRITTVNGTDTFDAGSINILYE